jgi:hypothetical protein
VKRFSPRTHAFLLLLAACGPGKPDADTEDAGTTTDPTPTTTESTASTPDQTTTAPDTTTDTTTDPTMPPPPDDPGAACSPVDGGGCGPGSVCCSDDPATTAGRLPNYFKPGQSDQTHGPPIFSGDLNNELSYWGRCVAVGGFASPFASGCPVPCNPRWNPEQLADICGGGPTTCCAFTKVDPTKDCILDGDTWRAVTGHDIPELTTWGALHATNQDPLGASCMQFASGAGMFDKDAFDDCVQQLTVADQRGFCYAAGECPCAEDLCDMKNPGWVPKCP